MLGKLMKYEIKATARFFLPLYAALLILALINKLFITINAPKLAIPSGIGILTYVLVIVAIFALTLIIMIQRFYKNLLGDEGYLMFTLPVKPRAHIVTKLTVSAMWVFVSSFFVILSGWILALNTSVQAEIIEAFSQLNHAIQLMGAKGFFYIFEFALMILVSMCFNILIIYAAISIGQLIHRHKLLASFGAYLLLNILFQIIVTIVATLIAPTITDVNGVNIDFGGAIHVTQPNLMHTVIWGFIVLSLAFSAGCYIMTNVILTKRLNLE